MNNDKPVVDNTQNVPEEVKIPEGETAEQKLARLEETNKKLYERAKTAEANAKELKAKIPVNNPEKPKIEDEVVADVKELKQAEKKRQFGYRNNLSPEETDLLFRYAGERDTNEAMKDEDFKDLLEVKRRRARVAEAIPSGSNRNIIVEGKPFESLTSEQKADYRRKNWKKLTKQE